MPMKTKKCAFQDGSPAGWKIFCPGCNREHVIPQSWAFNGDFNGPTFSPSIKCEWPWYGDSNTPQVCHSVIASGVIAFCDDCTHPMAGRSMPLPELIDAGNGCHPEKSC